MFKIFSILVLAAASLAAYQVLAERPANWGPQITKAEGLGGQAIESQGLDKGRQEESQQWAVLWHLVDSEGVSQGCRAALAFARQHFSPYFRNKIYRARFAEVKKRMPRICELAEARDIDPLLVSVNASFESSLRFDVVGRLGERGFLQVMPDNEAHAKRLEDPMASVKEGVEVLGQAFDDCGHLGLACVLGAYRTGKCCLEPKSAEMRRKVYETAISDYLAGAPAQ